MRSSHIKNTMPEPCVIAEVRATRRRLVVQCGRFETYGVTGRPEHVLCAPREPRPDSSLVWIFVMRVMMIIASAGSYLINEAIAKARYSAVARFNFEAPLTSLVWLTSIVSVILTYLVSFVLISGLGDSTLWWKLSTIITCGTLAGAIIPELVKVFTR